MSSKITHQPKILSNFFISLGVQPIETGLQQVTEELMNQEEIQLIYRAKSGDNEAFTILVEMHDARVMSVVRSILGPGFDAEEMYQEIFLKVHRKIHSFRFESEFSTWLHRITVNSAISRKRSVLKRRDRERAMDEDDKFYQSIPADAGENPENQQLRREVRDQIERALNRLPDRQRTVFVLKHNHGMKLKEIADMLQIGEGTAKAYLFRAIEKLHKALQPFYQAEI